MQPAADRLREALEGVAIGELSAPVISNVEAEPSQDRERVRDLLFRQVTSRVRWEASVRRALRMDVTEGLEVGHGKVLAGLSKRMKVDLRVRPVGSPDDIDVLKVEP
jgi:[acyl-carrier-protein] S-malonyltransferase